MEWILVALLLTVVCIVVVEMRQKANKPKEEPPAKGTYTTADAIMGFENRVAASGYEVSKSFVYGTGATAQIVAIDKENEVLIVNGDVVSFKDIIGAELLAKEYSTSTTSAQKSGGIGRAVVGGVLAGGAGAVVGASTAKSTGTTKTSTKREYVGILIYVADIDNPQIKISAHYGNKFCEDVYATILAIIAQEQRK
ncbi:MAG: hypothetical protein RR394_07805 [Oscillospiraceae bacterium]